MNTESNNNQMEKVVIKWLNQHYGKLTSKTTKKYLDSIFYVDLDNKVMMEYEQTNGNVWVYYYQIWLKLGSIFGLNYGDAQSIIKVWLKKTYKLENVTSPVFLTMSMGKFEEDYKIV